MVRSLAVLTRLAAPWGLRVALLLAVVCGGFGVCLAGEVEQTDLRGFEFRQGDSVALVGGALAERMQHHGWLETRLQARLPELGLTFRNLGFSGDELTVQQRVQGFGSPDEHLSRVGADVILAFWGFNESFAGEAGLPKFRRDLTAYIEHTRAQRYNGESAPRLVLFSPVAYEEVLEPYPHAISRPHPERFFEQQLPDPEAGNARLLPYVVAMRDVAREHDVPFVDVFGLAVHAIELTDFNWLQKRWFEFARVLLEDEVRAHGGSVRATVDGVRFSGWGNRSFAWSLEHELLGFEMDRNGAAFDVAGRVRPLVLEKNRLWFNRYRATDGYNVYGGRSGLTYDGVTNYEVLQHELLVLDAMCANLDREIHAAARGEPAPDPLPVPPLMTVETNRPGPNPDGSYAFLSGEDALARMTPAQGMQVELFADESMFPALRNPVQMSWDTRGRLWVATWPTYPHWTPGEPMDDALLVLEDVDGDGRADTCTPFVSDLHNPTGFEFWNGGVLVANPPDILFLKDDDGDGRVEQREDDVFRQLSSAGDIRERILGGLSSGDTHHASNSFVLGPGGALYFQEGIFHQSQVETAHGPVRNTDGCVWRYEPRTARVQRYVPYGFLNPHGHVFDRWGQDFVTDGTGNDNYYALPVSGHVEQGRKHGGYFRFFDQRSRPAAATEILSSAHFPAELQGNYLIANVMGFQGIFQYALHDDGSGFGATEVEPLVHSSDPNFRPVDIEVGPDGAVYFLDWQNPLIGHMQHHLRDPNRDHGHGRVYRVRMADRALLTPEPIAGRPIPELLALLHSPDDRVRYRTRIELSGRPRDEVVPAVRRWVEDLALQDVDPTHAMLEALWVQQAQGVLDRPLLRNVLDSREPRARAAAVRVLRWMRRDEPEALRLLAVAVDDEHPRVRLEAVVALSEFEQPLAAELALHVLALPMDRFLDYALRETVTTLAPFWRAALLAPEPFLANDERGMAYLLERLDYGELLQVKPATLAVNRRLLTLHDAELPMLAQSVRVLGAARAAESSAEARPSVGAAGGDAHPEAGAEPGAPPSDAALTAATADVWLDAVRAADARRDGHADHLLVNLFDALDELPPELLATRADDVAALSRDGARAATRRLATAASMRASGSAEPTWSEAARSLESLTALLDAAPMVRRERVAAELFPKVAALLDELPPALAAQAEARPGVVGRTLRIDLPGEARTLTLAEVQVFSGGENVALAGTATQSSTNWGGAAQRGVDGNTSGVFGDGGQTHTVEDQPDPWWRLELPRAVPIDRVVVWNRTEGGGQWISRLDGFVVTVLDEAGRAVFRSEPQRAVEASTTLRLTPPAVALRRAALRCLAELGVRRADAVELLLARFADPELRDAVVEALAAIPPDAWRAAPRERFASALLADFRAGDDARFLTLAGRRRLQLADQLAPSLPEALAAELRAARRELGPQVIVIRPVPDTLTFDLRAFTVQAGRPVELLVDNTDIMPHNLLVSAPGSLATVGEAAEAMAGAPDAWERAFVPERDEVLWATGLLQPGAQELLAFTAPEAVGDYPFLCTFPGHWIRMNGVMHVVDELPDGELVERRAAESSPRLQTPRPQRPMSHHRPQHTNPYSGGKPRTFVQHWSVADFDAVLGDVDGAHLPLGRWVAEEAGCLRCHRERPDADGARTGPPFSEVAARHDRASLLTAILDPSDTILEGYAGETFFLRDGRVLAGRVLGEHADGVQVLTDPYSAEPELVPHDAIDTRRPSSVSVMPEGLLSTFRRDEVLALIAYLESVQR